MCSVIASIKLYYFIHSTESSKICRWNIYIYINTPSSHTSPWYSIYAFIQCYCFTQIPIDQRTQKVWINNEKINLNRLENLFFTCPFRTWIWWWNDKTILICLFNILTTSRQSLYVSMNSVSSSPMIGWWSKVPTSTVNKWKLLTF